MAVPPHPVTPDGRYFVVRGRLWRMSDPALPETRRAKLVDDLMTARRTVALARRRQDAQAEAQARQVVHQTKLALGERGPVWWADGKPDLNRRLARNTEYAAWYQAVCGDGA